MFGFLLGPGLFSGGDLLVSGSVYPSGKLTWLEMENPTVFNREYIFKRFIFRCHVSSFSVAVFRCHASLKKTDELSVLQDVNISTLHVDFDCRCFLIWYLFKWRILHMTRQS